MPYYYVASSYNVKGSYNSARSRLHVTADDNVYREHPERIIILFNCTSATRGKELY